MFKKKKLRKPSVKSLRAGEYLRLREDAQVYANKGMDVQENG